METKDQSEKRRNKNLRIYHKKNPSLSDTKLARIFHLSPTRIKQILKVDKKNKAKKS